MLNKKNIQVSRLGIFVFYDKEGIVDDYVYCLLDGMMENLNHLVIVCNGKVQEKGLENFKKYTKDVFIRENIGYDATAWKMALTTLYGWDKVYDFDELVLFNDTFYGPIYSFKDMFDEMSTRNNADFWGITLQGQLWNSDSTITPIHLQSYFLVFREKLLKSKDFRLFFEKLEQINNYKDAVRKFEVKLTQHFADLGYKFDSFINPEPFISSNVKNNYNYSKYESFYLIYKYKCPIVKRKSFITFNRGILNLSGGQDASKVLNYIDKYTNYNIDMIWDNILRIYNISEIYRALHLDYILPENITTTKSNSLINDKVAVFITIFHEIFFDEWIHFIKLIPKEIDIYLTIYSQSAKSKLINLIENDDYYSNIQILNSNLETRLSFLISNKHLILKYNYVAFVNEDQQLGQYGPYIIDRTEMNNMWENTLTSAEYINNIICEFKNHNKLGLLMPPTSYHSKYFGIISLEWRNNYEKVKSLAIKIGLKSDINEEKPPFSFASSFWCRTNILDKILNLDFESSELKYDYTDKIFKLMLPYLAQDKGYYSGIVMSNNYATLQISVQNFMLGYIYKNNDISGYNNILQKEEIRRLVEFCEKYEKIYIYGVGIIGKKYSNYLRTEGLVFEAFIVSDGQPKETFADGHPVYYFSEINLKQDNIGVIVAIKDSADVIMLLKENAIKNVFKVTAD